MLKVYAMALGDYQTNCYIIHDEQSKTCCVIDPGYEADTILDKLDALNYVYMDYNPEVSQIAFLANNPNMVQINVFGTKVTQAQANKCLDQSIIVNYDPT